MSKDFLDLSDFEKLPDSSFIRLPALVKLFSISRSTIYRMIDEGSFPAGIKLTSRTVVWRTGQIREFINGINES